VRRTLKGSDTEPSAPQPRASGLHPVDWACEFAGTAVQLFAGFGIVALFESAQSPLPAHLSSGLRLIIIGASFGLLAAAVALSPIGRRSGAHLNPIVTLAFVLRGHTPAQDAAGYCLAQAAGALTAAAGFAAVWGSWADSVSGAQTAPAAGLPGWGTTAIEAALSFGLVITILLMVSSEHTARWTPAVVTGVIAGLIWAGAPHTGASMNPARTLGPDIVNGDYPTLWAYFAGPVIGTLVALVAYRTLAPQLTTLTAKLFHDERYPTVHASALPAKPHSGNQRRATRPASQATRRTTPR
jgi:aquaporin Z